MPKKPPGDGLPPGDATPSSNGGGQEEFRDIIRRLFQDEILPSLQRYLDEQVEARVAKATEGLGAPQAALDATAVAKEAAALLAPAFTRQVQGVADELAARIAQVAQQGSGGAGRQPPVATASPPAGEDTGKGGGFPGALALLETALDLGVAKIWPLYQQHQMTKMMGEYGGLVPLFQHIHDTNPYMAQIGAQIMAPNQLADAMTRTIPDVFGQGLLTGARQVRSLAQLFREPIGGGAPWPETPSENSTGGSPTPIVTPIGSTPGASPGTPGPTSGASMTQRPGPKPKIKFRPGYSEPKPAATGPGSRPGPSLREALG